MILSPIKCFLIQLTLTFVVLFYNTLAQTQKNTNEIILLPEIWCQDKIQGQFENQFPGVDIPDYIYVYTEICIDTLRSFECKKDDSILDQCYVTKHLNGYKKTNDTIQKTMKAIEGFKPIVEVSESARKNFLRARENFLRAKKTYDSDRDYLISVIDKYDTVQNDFKIAIDPYKEAESKCECARKNYKNARKILLSDVEASEPADETYTSEKTRFRSACINEYGDYINIIPLSYISL